MGHVRAASGVSGQRLPIDAFTGHAGAVTAFVCDSEATRSTHEIAGFVPKQHSDPSPSACF